MRQYTVIASLAALAVGASAQTVTVTTLEDVTDFSGARRVADLPGPDGKVSFREAVTATNNTPGAQTIAFAIPRDEWWLVDDMAVLKLEDGAFVVTDDNTTIDFSTQEDHTGDTNPDGPEVGIYGLQANGWGVPAIIVRADDCVFRGLGAVWLRGSSIAIWNGNRNRVVGCDTLGVEIDPYPEHCAFNVIGGTVPEDGNTLEFVELVCGADDNIIIGNALQTIFVGASPYCDTSSRNRIGGPTPEERNVISGFGSFGSEGFPVGEGIELSWATDTLIEGNYIGITADGAARAPGNGPTGIEINDSDNTIIRNNVVAGMKVAGRNHYNGQTFGRAIRVNAINRDNNNIVIEGNLIGTDATGQIPITTYNGIEVSNLTANSTPQGVRIGGAEPLQGNTIRFTDRTGIFATRLIADAEFSGNNISDNGLLGIDLLAGNGDFGVTPNDAGDADSIGANGLQNFPVLDTAQTDGTSVRARGTLNSRPNRSYRVELFASSTCDPSGYGEGERYLGSATVDTDGSGDAPFDTTVTGAVAEGEFITATATDIAAAATSEFSACIEAAQGGCAADLDGDGDADADDFFAYLDLFAAGDAAADLDNDGDTDADDFFTYLDLFAVGC